MDGRLNTISKRIPYFIQMVFGIVLIVWILTQVNAFEVFQYIASIRIISIFLVLLFFVGSLWVHYHQWKYLLLRNSIDFDKRLLVPSFFAGFALTMIMPGGHMEGGKLFLLGGSIKGKTIAFALEKISHICLKISLLALVVPLYFPKYWFACIAVLVLLFLMLLLVPRLKRINAFQENNVNMQLIFLKSIGYSFLIFLLLIGQYYVLLNETSPISLVATGLCIVYVYGASVLPLGILGIGISQSLAIYFLAEHGVSAEQTIAISLFLFTVNGLLPALIGSYMLSKHRVHFGELQRIIYSGYKTLIKGKSGGNPE